MPELPAGAKYVAIDPGETYGWAAFDEKGNVLDFDQFRTEDDVKELSDLLTSDVLVCITEDYKNYAWQKQKKWSRNQTSKNIGKIETLCELRGIKVVLQMANCYGIGAMWGGFEIPKNHSISHQYVAYAHGIYYLQSNGIRPVGLALDQQKDSQ